MMAKGVPLLMRVSGVYSVPSVVVRVKSGTFSPTWTRRAGLTFPKQELRRRMPMKARMSVFNVFMIFKNFGLFVDNVFYFVFDKSLELVFREIGKTDVEEVALETFSVVSDDGEFVPIVIYPFTSFLLN